MNEVERNLASWTPGRSDGRNDVVLCPHPDAEFGPTQVGDVLVARVIWPAGVHLACPAGWTVDLWASVDLGVDRPGRYQDASVAVWHRLITEPCPPWPVAYLSQPTWCEYELYLMRPRPGDSSAT